VGKVDLLKSTAASLEYQRRTAAGAGAGATGTGAGTATGASTTAGSSSSGQHHNRSHGHSHNHSHSHSPQNQGQTQTQGANQGQGQNQSQGQGQVPLGAPGVRDACDFHLSEADAVTLAREILTLSNRTETGGDTYFCIDSLLCATTQVGIGYC
jgi:hypothetical protein